MSQVRDLPTTNLTGHFQGEIGMKDVSGAAANPEGNRDFSNPMYEAMGGTDFGASNLFSTSKRTNKLERSSLASLSCLRLC
jgi:hypothetical protein